MKKAINYIGQLRIYNIVDLMVLLVAVGVYPNSSRFWGVALLVLGFFAHLECSHRHKERLPVTKTISWLLWVPGLILFGDFFGGISYIFLSLLYSKKNQGHWALWSPLFRGLQALVLVASVTSYFLFLPWLAFTLQAVRNFLGDLRDTEGDRADKMQTLPVLMGFETDWVFLHLIGVLVTTWIWFWFSILPIWIPLAANVVEILTYWLTPRPSNKKAFVQMQKLISRLGFP